MSIIIKGLDMPKTNEIMLIGITPNGKAQVSISKAPHGDSIRFEAEAMQIPTPHGRLIDENDVRAKCVNEVFDEMGTVAITETYFGDEWADDICDVPTIIEAEE